MEEIIIGDQEIPDTGPFRNSVSQGTSFFKDFFGNEKRTNPARVMSDSAYEQRMN